MKILIPNNNIKASSGSKPFLARGPLASPSRSCESQYKNVENVVVWGN